MTENNDRISPLFLRNCSPTVAFWDPASDCPSSALFIPSKKDNGCLSVAHSAEVTADEHYIDFTQRLRFESRGVWGFPERTFSSPDYFPDLIETRNDPGPDKPRGHWLIDMQKLTNRQRKDLARKLKRIAKTHGKLAPTSLDTD